MGSTVPAFTIQKFVKVTGPYERIFNIGYDSAPSASFPGAGVVSEPSYALGPHTEDILFGSPEEAKKRLKELRLNYFLLNFEEPFLMGLPFSRLFDTQNISRYFRVAAQEGSVFLLTWRERGQSGAEVPTMLIMMNELRRTGALAYPFSKMFERDLEAAAAGFIRGGRLSQTDEAGILLEDKIMELLQKNMMEPLEMPQSRGLAGQVVADLRANLKANGSRLTGKINENLLRLKTETDGEVSRELVWYVRSTTRNSCLKRLGPAFTVLVTGFKKSPVQNIYESREVFRRQLHFQ